VREIRWGGMGVVYELVQISLGRRRHFAAEAIYAHLLPISVQ
jgi:hypothetical protein